MFDTIINLIVETFTDLIVLLLLIMLVGGMFWITAEQQGRLIQHQPRDLLLRQQTQVINALRAHLAELGIVAAQGREGLKQLLTIVMVGPPTIRKQATRNIAAASRPLFDTRQRGVSSQRPALARCGCAVSRCSQLH